MSDLEPITSRRLLRVATAGSALLSVMSLAACSSSTTEPVTGGPGGGSLRPLTSVEQRAVGASNTLAFGLMRELGAGARGQNVVISPYSGAAALGLVMNGAAGTTRTGILQALGVGDVEAATANTTFRDLTTRLLSADRAVTVTSANMLWVAEGFPLAAPFRAAAGDFYAADTRNVRFGDAATTTAVNDWASRQTNGRIAQVFGPGELPSDLVTLVMNALYFKGTWTTRFDPAQTAPRPFTLANGATVQVPTMVATTSIPARVGGLNGVELLELPFGSGAYAMTFVLPDTRSVDDFVATLDDARWQTLLGTLRDSKTPVQLPKFALSGKTLWNQALTKLGMGDAFDPSRAQFGTLSPNCGCYVSFVQQNVMLQVDEAGAEAAAVTSVGVSPVSIQLPVVIDRPFVFAVREKATGAILFVGKVNDPR
jgi:serpin B